MTLEKYKKKRKFSQTPEPEGEVSKSLCDEIVKKYKDVKLERPVYVVQHHLARHEHWDLRLEIDGVLKSWAVPKEPPLEQGIKRLAVQVEDHPIEYASFEGLIPPNNYGAGKVEIWDRGIYKLESQKEDKIILVINGNKLKGRYCLIRLKDKKNWLLFKVKETKFL